MNPEEVREARKALGMTQQGLADALELDGKYSRDTVRSWENGMRPISGPAKVAIRLLLKYTKPKVAKKAKVSNAK
jgi:DNA-binding transcriptional regulator YiaG